MEMEIFVRMLESLIGLGSDPDDSQGRRDLLEADSGGFLQFSQPELDFSPVVWENAGGRSARGESMQGGEAKNTPLQNERYSWQSPTRRWLNT